MNGIGTLFASNPTVLALANFGALLALAFIIWAAVKKSVNFVKEVHRSTIRGAYRAIKLRKVRMSRMLAYDVHLFLVFLTGRSLSLMLAGILLTVGMVGMNPNKSIHVVEITQRWRGIGAVINEIAIPAIALTGVSYLGITTLSMIELVWRQRVKMFRADRALLLRRARRHDLAVEPLPDLGNNKA